MKTYGHALWLSLLICWGCSTSMMVNDNLQSDSQTFAVQGRQGWMVRQQLSFGPYQSGVVQRGWTRSYDIPFFVHFQGAKVKLQFELSDSLHQAQVFCLGKARQQELPMLEDLFDISLKDQEVFSGVIMTNFSTEPWYFVAQKNLNKLPQNSFVGVVHNHDQEIHIQEVRRTDQGHSTWSEVLGYEFKMGDGVVGAVETLNKGKVIIKNSVPEDIRLILASTSAALLLRNDLQEVVSS